jgi:hypothetical protein
MPRKFGGTGCSGDGEEMSLTGMFVSVGPRSVPARPTAMSGSTSLRRKGQRLSAPSRSRRSPDSSPTTPISMGPPRPGWQPHRAGASACNSALSGRPGKPEIHT